MIRFFAPALVPVLAAALSAVLLFSAGPALAGSTDCIYQALPAEKHALTDQAYDQSLEAGTAFAPFSREELEAALVACGVDLAGPGVSPAMIALAGREYQVQAQRRFVARGVRPERIEAAWAEVPAMALGLAKAAALEGDDADVVESMRAVSEPFVRALGLPTDADNLEWAAAYLSGRAMREAQETRF